MVRIVITNSVINVLSSFRVLVVCAVKLNFKESNVSRWIKKNDKYEPTSNLSC